MTPKKILFIIGGNHHPFQECGVLGKAFVEATGQYEVTLTEDRNVFCGAGLASFDGVMVYTQGGALSPEQEAGLVAFVQQGGAFVGLHSATASWKENDRYIEMLGGVFAGHGPVHTFPVTIVDHDSPLTTGIADFSVTDELYVLDRFDPAQVHVLATAPWEGKDHPVLYTKPYGAGKVYYNALGHDERTFSEPVFQELVLRGLKWALERG